MTLLSDLITQVRSAVEDPGDTITDNFTGDASTTVWRLSSKPIGTDSDTVTVASAAQTRGTAYTINYNNAEITFTSAPANGAAVVVTYTLYQWRTARVIDGINAGIRRLPPKVYRPFEVYVLMRNDVWDYDLTNTTDVPEASSFTDQTIPADYIAADSRSLIIRAQSRIHYADYRRYGSNQVYTPFELFGRTTVRNIHLDVDPAPNDTLRLACTGPFKKLENLDDETDVPEDFIDLPVWYALGTMLGKKEGPRARSDSYAVEQNENANPPGTQAKAGADHMAMFHEFLRDNAMRPMRMSQRRRLRDWERHR